MTYPNHQHAHALTHNDLEPLIDPIANIRDSLDVSDEEEGFYDQDEKDHILPPKVQQAIATTTHHIPQPVKRHPIPYITITLLCIISWLTYFGPRHTAHKHEINLMDNTPTMTYGNNVRPAFKGMIQVSDMDEQHLPKQHSRLVFVGDVHGCKEDLEHLLRKIDFNHKHDHLVLTGDMIAKGPDSPGVIKLAQRMGASCVRGNWEDKLLLSIADAQERHVLLPGPDESPDTQIDFLDETSHSHGDYKLRQLAKKFTKAEIEYLQRCPVILRVGSVPQLGALVAVHAGLVPDKPLEHQDPFHVMNMRSIDLDTRIPSSKHSGTPWEKFWNHRQMKLKEEDRVTVVYGHNRKKGLNIREYTYGLDTGCVSGGKLTALVIDGKGGTEIVHVKCGKEGGYASD
jgi:hypothetical protein